MAINLYDVYDQHEREKCHAAYVADIGFKALEAKAEERGFRHASSSELHASAEAANGAPDLFCWAGGLWVKT